MSCALLLLSIVSVLCFSFTLAAGNVFMLLSNSTSERSLLISSYIYSMWAMINRKAFIQTRNDGLSCIDMTALETSDVHCRILRCPKQSLYSVDCKLSRGWQRLLQGKRALFKASFCLFLSFSSTPSQRSLLPPLPFFLCHTNHKKVAASGQVM